MQDRERSIELKHKVLILGRGATAIAQQLPDCASNANERQYITEGSEAESDEGGHGRLVERNVAQVLGYLYL